MKPIFLFCFLLIIGCASPSKTVVLTPAGKKIKVSSKDIASCQKLKDFDISDKSPKPMNNALIRLKNETAMLGGTHLYLKKIFTRGEGEWAYAQGQALKCSE